MARRGRERSRRWYAKQASRFLRDERKRRVRLRGHHAWATDRVHIDRICAAAVAHMEAPARGSDGGHDD